MHAFLCPNFPLDPSKKYGALLVKEGVKDFHEALIWIKKLPYKKISDLDEVSLVALEKMGTCSSKHGLLALIAEENGHPEIHLEMGYFRFSKRRILALQQEFEKCGAEYFIEAHCYLKFAHHIVDVTSAHFDAQLMYSPRELIESRKLNPDQAGEFKQKLHRDYFEKWCERNQLDFDCVWKLRSKVIDYLVQNAR